MKGMVWKPLVHSRGVMLGRDKRHASAVQKPLTRPVSSRPNPCGFL